MGAQCSIVANIEQIQLTSSNKEKDDEHVIKKLHDLEKVARFLVRVISFNQKMIWVLLIFVISSIILWGKLYFDNPIKIIDAIDANKAKSNEYSLEFKTVEGNYSIALQTYYPVRKIHLTQIKDALDEY